MKEKLKVSVIIPCLNEEKFIAKCLDSLLQNDYPHQALEILVVDGESQDRTREIIESYSRKHAFIRLLDNPKRLTPAALNCGIRKSTGEIIIRMDAHSAFETTYISKCVDLLNHYQADNIGGIIRTLPQRQTSVAHAIAYAMAHPFGVGRSEFRMAEKQKLPREVDTVPYGCFRRSLFEKIGYFDENLPNWRGRCNEDFDFNQRIKKAGGKVLLTPEIESTYFARGTLREFLRHNFNNGVLATIHFEQKRADFSVRHLVPLLFVASLFIIIPLSVAFAVLRYFLLAPLAGYFVFNLYFSFKATLRRKNSAFLFLMPTIFFLLHLSYGIGSLYGLWKLFLGKLKKASRFAAKLPS